MGHSNKKSRKVFKAVAKGQKHHDKAQSKNNIEQEFVKEWDFSLETKVAKKDGIEKKG
jgi:hypothetical protein